MDKKVNQQFSVNAAPGVHEKVLSLLTDEPRGKVLDAAAGSGSLSRKLKNMGFEVVAADLNLDNFKATEINFQRVDLNKNLPFPDNFFNYVICVEGIEHLENPFHLLKEFKKILCKGGKLILTTPNVLNIHSRIRYLFFGYSDCFYTEILKRRPADTYHLLGQHINPIDFIKLKHILKKNNFVLEGIFTNGGVLLYPGGKIFLKPLVIPTLFLSTVLVKLTVKLFRHDDPVVKELLCKEILMGEILILKARKE